MSISVSREVKLLSLSFLLIFLGFNGVQSFVTPYFSESNIAEVGFRSLIFIYLFFLLFDPLAAIFVSKYGAKKCMIASSIFYSFYILSLLSKTVILIYFASILLGIAASLLWIGQGSYLIRASDEKSYGANAGFFNSFQSLGSALGVLILGFLIGKFLFKAPFLVFSFFPLVGFFLLFSLRDLKVERKADHFKLIKKSILSKTALKLSTIFFVTQFTYGLVIGIIPIQVKETIGISFVGVLSSLFYLFPIFLSFFFGKMSDIKGRKGMIIFSYLLLLVSFAFLIFSQDAAFLIIGILLLALNISLIRPITYALVGDVSTKANLEFLTSLFWMAQGVGIVISLFLSDVFREEVQLIYLVSVFAIIASLLILLPLLRMKLEEIKEKISREVS